MTVDQITGYNDNVGSDLPDTFEQTGIILTVVRSGQVREQSDPFAGKRRGELFALYAIISDLKSHGFGH